MKLLFRSGSQRQGAQRIIDMCMKHYEQTQAALKVAFDGYCALGEMLKQVKEFYNHSYGHDFELTK